MFFLRQKKQSRLSVDGSAAPPDWEAATVFFTQRSAEVVHLMVLRTLRPLEPGVEIEAPLEAVPPDLRHPIVCVEVLMQGDQLLGVRHPGPGMASWFSRSYDARANGSL